MHTDEHARATGWAWRWTGWASWPISAAVLWVCAAAVVLDVTTSWLGEPEWYLGRISLSPALPLAALLVALIGPGHLGCSRQSLRAWREFLLLGGPIVLVWCISYPQSVADWRDVEGIVVAVAGEELVYRLAAVLLIGAVCARLAGRNWRDTGRVGNRTRDRRPRRGGPRVQRAARSRGPDDRRRERRALLEPGRAPRVRGAAFGFVAARASSSTSPSISPRWRSSPASCPAGCGSWSTSVRCSAWSSVSCSPVAASASAGGSRASSTCAATSARSRPSRADPGHRGAARPPRHPARTRSARHRPGTSGAAGADRRRPRRRRGRAARGCAHRQPRSRRHPRRAPAGARCPLPRCARGVRPGRRRSPRSRHRRRTRFLRRRRPGLRLRPRGGRRARRRRGGRRVRRRPATGPPRDQRRAARASACSTTSPSPRPRWSRAGNVSSSSTGTCTTATAPRTSSGTIRTFSTCRRTNPRRIPAPGGPKRPAGHRRRASR